MHVRTASFLLVIALTIVLTAGPGGAQAPEALSFQVQRGRAALSRTGGSTWLTLGPEPAAVKVRDLLRTEGESRGELRFPDGSRIRLHPDTLLTVLPDGALIQVGEAWFSLHQQGKPFQVVTPTTICTVLGTTFDVAVDKYGRTQVRVFEGIVGVRARDDQRRRQIVLQRGMWTNIRDRGFTGDQIQKFDAGALEDELQKAWNAQAPTGPTKIGPERTGLPPIRPTLPDQLRTLGPDGTPVPLTPGAGPGTGPSAGERIDTIDESPDVRTRLHFFEQLRQQRMRDRERLSRAPGRPAPALPDPAWRSPYPGLPFDREDPPGWQEVTRQGHGRLTGQASPAPTGVPDERSLREELRRTEERLVQVQNEFAEVDAERRALVKKAEDLSRPRSTVRGAPGDGMTLEQLTWRIGELQNRLLVLRDNHRHLSARLSDLRNRLR
jgi:hypothetical protein